MEALILGSLTKLQGAPGIVPMLFSIAVLVFGGLMFFKKTSIEENTSAGALHTKQIETLMAQVKMLSDELTLARKQLHEIHEQNMDLMKQVRDSNMKIQELETMLSKYELKQS